MKRKPIFLYAFCFLAVFAFNNITLAKEIPYKIGVNRFAWYASLQLINFMPLSSADPFSGVIITDWFSLNNNEKYKIDVYILEENLTSNTVEVRVFKQTKIGAEWVASPVSKSVSTKIEDAILNTARQLRIQYMLGEK